MADGWITIGTELATDKFDRQIVDLEKKMKKEEDKKIVIQTKLDTETQDLERAKEKTDELANAYQRLSALKEKANKTPTEFSEMQGIQQQFGSLDRIGSDFDKALTKQDALEQKVAQTKIQYDGINSKVSEYKNKIDSINLQKHQSQINQVSNGFKSVGSSIQDAVHRAGRLVLGIFAIRSAYMALRQTSSYLASYDKQYAANIEYIRYALTQMIAPVLQWIVSLAATVLKYINMILNALFGINLFSRGSAESFNKMKAGAGGVSKAVKEIKKQLTGFDEINMLTDQSDTGTKAGGGGVGAAIPDFDLSALDGEQPKWLDWLVKHKNELLSIFAGILGFLTALKLGLGFIKSLGIGLLISGIVYAITNLLDYLKNPTWKSFGGIIQGIGGALVGLGIALGNFVVGAVGAGFIFYGTIIKYWDQIHDSMQAVIDWLREQTDWVEEHFGVVGKSIYEGIVDTLQAVLNKFDVIFTSIRAIFDGFIEFFKGVFSGNWGRAWEGIKQIFEANWNSIKGLLMVFADWLYAIVVKPAITIFGSLWNSIKEGAQGAWNWITSIFGNIANWFNNIINIIVNKFRDMGTRVGETVSGAFRNVVNAVLGQIERILNKPIGAINSLISVINSVPGINLGRLSSVNLPRLKTGAIINMPNKGTLIGGTAIGGEAGREGIVPLTDQQAMAELGREIGKNVLVNLTNITQMNGRVLAREMKQVQSEQNFAFNQ